MLAAPSSDAIAMAWNWVIQSIAKSKQVDLPTLAGLVVKVPEIILGKDTKEMVSLRILESLFLHENEVVVDADSAQNDKISFDRSKHCEDILRKILEASEPMTELERKKWNIRPFIIHKRASLPKIPVQKFKEALFGGSHPIFESLKEMSRLGGAKVSENTTISGVDVGFNAQTTLTKEDLVFLNTEIENGKLQENPLHKSDHVEDSDERFTGDVGRKDHETTIEPTVKDLEETSLMDNFEDSSRGITRHSKRKEEMTIEPQVKDLEENNLIGHVERIVSNTPEHQQPPVEDDEQMTDFAAIKEAFMSSQDTHSQDFMSTADFTETFLCMKCSKGGRLLVCSSETCPFRVHEHCLGSVSTFNENEDFICPFCLYSHTISKYMEVKKKASLARKDLQTFLSSEVTRKSKISFKPGVCCDENASTQNGATCEKFKLNSNEQAMSRGKDCALVGSLHQPVRQDGMAKQPSTSKNLKRAREQEPQYTSTTITLPPRRAIFWDKEEEEMLKEGMQKFYSDDNKRIPWKQILDFGRDIFKKGRTTVDLKDKWRNMCKKP